MSAVSEPKYTSGVSVSIGSPKTLSLPPRVFRGRLTGMLFDTDKAFLLPSAMGAIQELKFFYDDHPGLHVLVSGHADRAGSADYNRDLSVERAESIEAFLQDQVDKWMAWYGTGKPAAKRWGVREDQHMLSFLKDPSGKVYYEGPVHGRNDPATQLAVTKFRTDEGLGEGGLDDGTRKKLVEKYMATDDTTLPAGTPLRHHGCGEFHPAVATADGASEPENRRVEVFFFEGDVDPPPQARCPNGGCPEYPKWLEEVTETIDVNVKHDVTFTIVDELGLPWKSGKVKLTYPDGRKRDASTDADGKFHARLGEGESLDVEFQDVHEASAGDGVTTPSGAHFAIGTNAPKEA
jgi:outer membrane protein OmpA-like peptidoglycan-associated protein